jgi:hypothetical protein
VAGYTLKGASFDENNFVQFTVHNRAQVPVVIEGLLNLF